MRDNVIRDILLTGIALASTGLSRIVYNIVISRSFGADALGQANLMISLIMILSMVTSLITENSAIKFLSEFADKADRQHIISIAQKWSIILSIMAIVIAYLLKDPITKQMKLDQAVYLISLPLILFIVLHHFYRGCFYGLSMVGKYFKFEMLSTIFFFIALVANVYVCRDNLLLPFLLYYGIFSILGAANLWGYLVPRKDSFYLAREIGIYGLIAMMGTMASTSRAYIANISTGYYLSPEQVGFYSAAVSITTVLMYAPSIFGRVLLPSMSRSYGEGDIRNIKKLLDTTTFCLSLVALFLAGSFIILSKDILVMLFKSEFAEATFSLQMLILGLCMSTVVVPSVTALSGTKYVKIPTVVGVAGFLVSLALWPILIPRFGINGTAIGYIVGSIINSGLILYFSKKYFNLNLKTTFQAMLVSLLIFSSAILIEGLLPIKSHLIAAAIFVLIFLMVFRKEILRIYYRFKSGL